MRWHEKLPAPGGAFRGTTLATSSPRSMLCAATTIGSMN
jgi:hypothetical protein